MESRDDSEIKVGLPNEIWVKIVQYLTDPVDWITWSVLNWDCRKMIEYVFLSKIQSLHLYLVPSFPYTGMFSDRTDDKRNPRKNLWIGIRIANHSTLVEYPLHRFYKGRNEQSEYKQKRAILYASLPYLWKNSPKRIGISFISEEEVSKPEEEMTSSQLPNIHEARHSDPEFTVQIMTQLHELQNDQPKELSDLQSLPPQEYCLEAKQRFFTTWQTTLMTLQTTTKNISPAVRVKALESCPITHLIITSWPNTLEDDWNSQHMHAPTDKLDSKPINIEFAYAHRGVPFPEAARVNLEALRSLLGSLTPALSYQIVLPPPPLSIIPSGFRRNVLLEVSTRMTPGDKVSPIRQSLILNTPIYDLYRGSYLGNTLVHTLSWKYLTTFPYLTEIQGLSFTKKLMDQIAKICMKALQKGRPVRLNIQCREERMRMNEYVHLVIHLLQISHQPLWHHAIMVSMTTPDFKENKTFRCTYQTTNDLVVIVLVAPLKIFDAIG
jgi:hypothetical protein